MRLTGGAEAESAKRAGDFDPTVLRVSFDPQENSSARWEWHLATVRCYDKGGVETRLILRNGTERRTWAGSSGAKTY
jgi:hypothetical protein